MLGRSESSIEGVRESTAEQRRARAADDPTRWRVGGSEGTHGLTIYRGNELHLVSVVGAQTAAYVVSVLNQAEQAGRVLAAGDRLDAERRGGWVGCPKCVHQEHELTCLAVVDAARGERCACCHRKSEQAPL